MTSRLLHTVASRIFAFITIALVGGLFGMASQAFSQSKELSLADILIALRSKKAVIEEKNKILTDAVKQRGITFSLTPEIEKELDSTGAQPVLIAAIRERTHKSDPVKQVAASLAEPKPVQSQPVVKEPVLDFAFYRTRANQRLTSNDLEGAMADLDKAGEFKPDDASVYAARGVVYLRKESYDLALAQFGKAIEYNSKDAVSYFNSGMIKERLGRADEALKYYEKAADIDPSDESAKAAVGRIKKAQADTAAALAAAKLAEEEKAAAAKGPIIVSVGALNAYATKLTVPIYPPLERRLGTRGIVTVLVSLDTDGKVTKAKAVDGPKQLWTAAEYAVKNSKFKPVEQNGKPVLASGTISFNFTL